MKLILYLVIQDAGYKLIQKSKGGIECFTNECVFSNVVLYKSRLLEICKKSSVAVCLIIFT